MITVRQGANSPKGEEGAGAAHNVWLDVCRGLAILLVLLSHGRYFLTPVYADANVLRIGGFLGVELFFVLSGFLIGGIVERHFRQSSDGRGWLSNFLCRRWLRTLPNYYLFLAINVLLVASAVTPGRLADLVPFAFFMQNLAWPGPSLFGEAWSLAVEEVFYLVFPLALYFLGKLEPDWRKVFLTVTLMLLFVPLLARLAAVLLASPNWSEGIRKVVVFRLDALMAGVLAGWLVHEYRLLDRFNPRLISMAATAVLALAITSYFILGKTIDQGIFFRVFLLPLVSLGFAMAILSGLKAACWPAALSRIANVLARLSYALYLAHMPIFHLIRHYFGDTQPGDMPGAITRWSAFMLGSILVAALVERHFERPILAWRDRAFPR
ncbi:MAG: acyltransferase [Rhodocyclaceae bacterium]|nr:acyltransferase [Rhodocyclaceae bacterium]